MRKDVPEILEKGRLREGLMASDASYGLTGMFHVLGPCGQTLRIISSGNGPDSMGWEHVSVSLRNRCPNWPEMCFVKDLYWNDDEVVMQLHPAKADYINVAEHCLHLWKPIGQSIPLPPSLMVGPKTEEWCDQSRCGCTNRRMCAKHYAKAMALVGHPADSVNATREREAE